jgi:hypothetical protein
LLPIIPWPPVLSSSDILRLQLSGYLEPQLGSIRSRKKAAQGDPEWPHESASANLRQHGDDARHLIAEARLLPHALESAATVLEADHGLAAETAVAKLFENLARAVQFNYGADARSDRAVREHMRNLVQALRRRQGTSG